MSTQDPNDPLVGTTLVGRYQLRRIVADGGMGRVYEASDTAQQGRRVAVKVLHPDVASDPVNIERFKREAETSQALPHPHITEVYDFAQARDIPGRPEGVWYLVMEFLDGQELRAVLDHQPVQPLPRLIRIFSQCALALDFAHAQGVVHRDLKPDNIFLVNREGTDHVKLLDFGSVKFTKGQDRGQKLTVMGTTIGSPHYMSPEQAKGSATLDHRADVWALGVILYEGTVGTVPFHASNAPQILFKILGEEVNPPSFANAALPEALDDIIALALAKPLERRYNSVGAFADGLGHAFGLQGTHHDWAQWSAADIAGRMGQARPTPPKPILSVPPPKAMGPQLHPMNAPVGMAQPKPPSWQQPQQQQPQYPMASAQGSNSPDLGPVTLPVRNSPVALFAVLGLLVLALVVVVALALKS